MYTLKKPATQIKIMNIPITPVMAPGTLYNPFLVARQTLFCFLSLYLSLHFLGFYTFTQKWTFVCGFLCSAKLYRGSSMLLCMANSSFLLISDILLYGFTTIHFSIQLLVDIWVVSEFGFTNKTALNVRVHVFIWMYTFILL